MPNILRYIVLAVWLTPCAAFAATPVKSAKYCNEELQKNEAALKAAGETAAAFIHACWWTSKPGEPTPIVKGASVAPDAPIRTAGPREAAPRSSRRSIRAARDEPVERVHRERRVRSGPSFDVEEPVGSLVAAPEPIGVTAFRPTATVDVTLPGLGRVPVPILPGFEPAARGLVENPAVPGLLMIRP